jgi:hypothetical protein
MTPLDKLEAPVPVPPNSGTNLELELLPIHSPSPLSSDPLHPSTSPPNSARSAVVNSATDVAFLPKSPSKLEGVESGVGDNSSGRAARPKGLTFAMIFLSLCVSSFLSAMDLVCATAHYSTIQYSNHLLWLGVTDGDLDRPPDDPYRPQRRR